MELSSNLFGQPDVIRLNGSPKMQGLAHGRRARAAIEANLELAELAVRARSKRYPKGAAERLLAENEAYAAREAPGLLEEIRGIAEGAALDYRDVLRLNLPVFLVWNYLTAECTQILIAPPATGDGQTYLAKTRDLALGRLRHVVLHRTYPDGGAVVEVSAAGSVTWPGSGMNSAGLALSTSGVWSSRMPFDSAGASKAWLLVNTHLLLRECRSVRDLIERLEVHPRLTSMNIVAADPGSAAAIETAADRLVWSRAVNGILVRTNHFTTAELTGLTPTSGENPSSYHRYAVALADTERQAGRYGTERLVELLASHDGYPQSSICRHRVNDRGSETVYASIAAVPEGRFTVVLGTPCQTLTTPAYPRV